MDNNEEEKTQLSKISVKELQAAIDLMKETNAVSEKMYIRYQTMVDFIESKGLTNEYKAYFMDQFLKRQNPVGN